MIEIKWAIFLGAVIAFCWKMWAVYFENEKLKRRLLELERRDAERARDEVREGVYNTDLEHLVDQSNQRFGAKPRGDSQ
jgi:hypothetical protein